MKLSDLVFGGLLVAALASAPSCSQRHEASCDAAFTHIRELTPETMSVEERRCALAAKSILDVEQPD